MKPSAEPTKIFAPASCPFRVAQGTNTYQNGFPASLSIKLIDFKPISPSFIIFRWKVTQMTMARVMEEGTDIGLGSAQLVATGGVLLQTMSIISPNLELYDCCCAAYKTRKTGNLHSLVLVTIM